ncbi:MAG: hypothetical protein IKE60_02255 [Reyranella sp.]|uniref:hypothetical protein n=1 Tax=Reyranella sp. TaxID=1929291 RepID=UPI0025F7670B|nr:hypothetical protein [Reyranella sp.]MBR2813444.1 hypothetical protein [Reyranella sp.]
MSAAEAAPWPGVIIPGEDPQAAEAAGFSRYINVAGGEVLMVPDALWQAIDAAMLESAKVEELGASRIAFGYALVAQMFAGGLVVAPRCFSKSREQVDVNVYTLALAAKHNVERRLSAVARLLGALNTELGPLLLEHQRVIDALTGHAPPAGASRLGSLDERLRLLRQVVLGVPEDAPADCMDSGWQAPAETPASEGDAA